MALALLWQSVLRRLHCSRTCCALQQRPSAAFGTTAVSRQDAGASAEPREAMEYDVCIVGAGPAGLSAAIRLKQARACWHFLQHVCICMRRFISRRVMKQMCALPKSWTASVLKQQAIFQAAEVFPRNKSDDLQAMECHTISVFLTLRCLSVIWPSFVSAALF